MKKQLNDIKKRRKKFFCMYILENEKNKYVLRIRELMKKEKNFKK